MNNVSHRIGGLVTLSVLDDFERATKALWRDIRLEGLEVDIIAYMAKKMAAFAQEAEQAGPMTIEQNPLIGAAVEYVKHRQGNGEHQAAAKEWAIHLYDLDAEAVRVMKRELDKI